LSILKLSENPRKKTIGPIGAVATIRTETHAIVEDNRRLATIRSKLGFIFAALQPPRDRGSRRRQWFWRVQAPDQKE